MKKKSSRRSSNNKEKTLSKKKAILDANGYNSLCFKSKELCEFCDEIFNNRYDLIKHNITHMIIPLIKLTEQCKICLQHFTSADDLDSHMSNTHNNNKNNVNFKRTPGILQSIVDREALVKCKLDKEVDALIRLSENAVNSTESNTNGVTESQKNKTNDGDHARVCQTQSDIETSCQSQSDIDILNVGVTGNCSGVKEEKENVKEEPLSPPIKERASSPFDEDKEPMRNRLLFEEDIEDTLYQDLSNECNLNIDKLCQEVTLDFDNTILVSDSDDDSIGFDKSLYGQEEVNDEMNNIDIGGNILWQKQVFETINSSINNFKYGIDEFKCQESIENGIDSVKQENFNTRSVLQDFSENVCGDSEFGMSIHYDDLILPEILSCRLCALKFPNRFQLIQHEATHMTTKKSRVLPFCCHCDRYIAGNHKTLQRHILEKHPKYISRNYISVTKTCTKCGLVYFNYNRHLYNYHRSYTCEECTKAFDTLLQMESHKCARATDTKIPVSDCVLKYSLLKYCDMCYTFMKSYMDNRQNYELIGTISEVGVMQTCDKCNNKFFSVQLVKRKPRPFFGQKTDVLLSKKRSKSTNKQKNGDVGKPCSNKQRLLKIHQRLKMLKMLK